MFVISEQHAGFVACLGSVISIVLCLYFIPTATKKPESRSKECEYSVKVAKHTAAQYLSGQERLFLPEKDATGFISFRPAFFD